MALLFLDGFDKYGPANSNSTAVAVLLTAGEWTASGGTGHGIAAALSATGYAYSLSGGSTILTRTLVSNYARLIGGFRFSSSLAALGGIQFNDAGSNQAAVYINTTGTVSVRNGVLSSGTVLGTSTATVSASSTHYLEFDLTFANAGSYQVWLDGVSVLSGSGDTTTTANNYANQISLQITGANVFTVDDLYILDTTGSAPLNAVLLTSPRIETQFPTGDGAVQFAAGAAILGNSVSRTVATAYNNGPNGLYVRPFTPAVSCTLNSIVLMPATTNASVNWRPVVYADNSGAPGTLMSSGSTVTGITSGTARTMPLTTPQALTAGTQYWLGYMQDITLGLSATIGDTGNTGRFGTNTFASGAPGTPTISLTSQSNVLLWGNVATSATANWYSAGQNPTQGSFSYVYEATVGEEDLYTYPALSVPPLAIYAVAVKASVAKSDAGSKTVSMRMKSGATDSAGTGGAQAPGTTYGWLTTNYPLDPNGSVAWTQSALNAAQSGVKVES